MIGDGNISKRCIFRIISILMLIVAAVIFCLALSSPTVSADPRITQPLFYGWIVIAIALFIASFFIKSK